MAYSKSLNQAILYGGGRNSNRKKINTFYFDNLDSGATSGSTPINLTPPYNSQGDNVTANNSSPTNVLYGENNHNKYSFDNIGGEGNATPADTGVDVSYTGNIGEGTVPVTGASAEGVTHTTVQPATEVEKNSDGVTVNSYYDYLKTEMPEYLNGIYNDTIAAIDKSNAQTIAQINAAKERGIVDASTSYEQNKATYGANAEALASMGLTGSGYSDYLNAQAYAAQRAEVQGIKSSALYAENEAKAAADAKKLEAKTALDERLLYYDNLAEQHLEGKWSDILAGAGDGTYSKERVESLAKYYGFSEEQVAQLMEEARQYQQNTYKANTNTASGNITPDTTDYEIQDMVDQGLIDAAGAEKLEEDRKQAQIKEINYYFDIGDYPSAISLADKYYDNGNGTIDKDTYQKAYFDFWVNSISEREGANVDDIMQDIADVTNQRNAGKLSAKDAEALISYLKKYCTGSLSCSVKNVNSDTCELAIGDITYKNVMFQPISDARTLKALYDLTDNTRKNGTCVKIDDNIFMYLNNEWVYIFGRININKNFYEGYNTALRRQGKPSKPTHVADTASAGVGGSSGGTGLHSGIGVMGDITRTLR